MASSKFALLLLAFSLLAVCSAARPCKTLFFITTTTITTSTSYHHHIRADPTRFNPNFPQFQTLFITTSPDPTRFGRFRPSIIFRRSHPFLIRRPDPILISRPDPVEHVEQFYSSVTNSIRDRTKDIMRVVGALLFGVGCGAVTAAAMYLIWSLFSTNRYDFDDSDNDDFEKLGYVAIPNKVVDDDLKKPAVAPAPVPVKEVV